MKEILRKYILGVVNYFDTEISFKRSTVLFALTIFYGFSFAHQIKYGVFSPMLYMWLLLMLLAYLVIFSKETSQKNTQEGAKKND